MKHKHAYISFFALLLATVALMILLTSCSVEHTQHPALVTLNSQPDAGGYWYKHYQRDRKTGIVVAYYDSLKTHK